MSFTVKQLASLSRVSIRTLHFYDEIGLLKPAYYGDNEYRYYEEEQLLLLQQILFYRELGFPLRVIKSILESGDFDKVKALQAHRKTLKNTIEKQQQLLRTIDNTIQHLEGKQRMKHEEFFYGFDSEKQKNYEQELITSGYVTDKEMKEYRKIYQGWTQEDKDKFIREGDEIHKALVAASKDRLSVGSEAVQKLMKRHYDVILGWKPDKNRYAGLMELYQTAEFKKFYDHYDKNLLSYLIAAMEVFSKRYFN